MAKTFFCNNYDWICSISYLLIILINKFFKITKITIKKHAYISPMYFFMLNHVHTFTIDSIYTIYIVNSVDSILFLEFDETLRCICCVPVLMVSLPKISTVAKTNTNTQKSFDISVLAYSKYVRLATQRKKVATALNWAFYYKKAPMTNLNVDVTMTSKCWGKWWCRNDRRRPSHWQLGDVWTFFRLTCGTHSRLHFSLASPSNKLLIGFLYRRQYTFNILLVSIYTSTSYTVWTFHSTLLLQRHQKYTELQKILNMNKFFAQQQLFHLCYHSLQFIICVCTFPFFFHIHLTPGTTTSTTLDSLWHWKQRVCCLWFYCH